MENKTSKFSSKPKPTSRFTNKPKFKTKIEKKITSKKTSTKKTTSSYKTAKKKTSKFSTNKRLRNLNGHINFEREGKKTNARKWPTEVICCQCRKRFELPFKPRNPEVYCDECFKNKKQKNKAN